jgi:hypothetical protein
MSRRLLTGWCFEEVVAMGEVDKEGVLVLGMALKARAADTSGAWLEALVFEFTRSFVGGQSFMEGFSWATPQ